MTSLLIKIASHVYNYGITSIDSPPDGLSWTKPFFTTLQDGIDSSRLQASSVAPGARNPVDTDHAPVEEEVLQDLDKRAHRRATTSQLAFTNNSYCTQQGVPLERPPTSTRATTTAATEVKTGESRSESEGDGQDYATEHKMARKMEEGGGQKEEP